MPNKADATRLRLLVAIKSRALTLVSASDASVVDVLLMWALDVYINGSRIVFLPRFPPLLHMRLVFPLSRILAAGFLLWALAGAPDHHATALALPVGTTSVETR